MKERKPNIGKQSSKAVDHKKEGVRKRGWGRWVLWVQLGCENWPYSGYIIDTSFSYVYDSIVIELVGIMKLNCFLLTRLIFYFHFNLCDFSYGWYSATLGVFLSCSCCQTSSKNAIVYVGICGLELVVNCFPLVS